MNKNILIPIIVIAIAIIAASYFNHEHDKSPNSLKEFGNEIGHELDEIGDNIKKK